MSVEEKTKETQVKLTTPEETLLKALKDVQQTQSELGNAEEYMELLDKGDVTLNEMKQKAELSNNLKNLLEIALRNIHVRKGDLIEDNLEEITRLTLEISHKFFLLWPKDVIDFLINHGTSVDAIDNFLTDQRDAEKWEIRETENGIKIFDKTKYDPAFPTIIFLG